MKKLVKKLLVPRHLEYIIVDRDLNILQTSEGVQRFADRHEEAIAGKDIRLGFPELIGTEDILLAVLQEQQQSFELKGIGRFPEEGLPLYMDFFVNPYRDEESRESYAIIFFEDVTERMNLEQRLVQSTNEANLLLSALSQSETYINKIISSMADALIVTNREGIVKTVNKTAEKLFQYSEDEFIGKPISQFVCDKNFLNLVLQENILADSDLKDIQVACQTKFYKKLFVEFSCSAIQSDIKEVRDVLYIGRDISDRRHIQQRLSAQYSTARILSESATLKQATPKILLAICESLEWTLGELWMPEESSYSEAEGKRQAQHLRCVEIWSRPSAVIEEFIEVAKQTSVAIGEGLPGLVWATNSPQWMEDVVNDASFGRGAIAAKAGLHAAFGFPIQSDSEILGVMTFFSREVQPFDEDLLHTISAIGNQLGQFIKRKQVEEALRHQQEQTERLLLNILPEPIADRLKQETSTIAESFADVTVLFADIVGFTQIASYLSPIELVSLLNQIFSAFDRLTEKYGLEKIKTIGDAYMVVGGLPNRREDHAEAIAEMALGMQAAIARFNVENNQAFSIRIGIHSGAVVAGVIGIKKFIYDLWGDTVNLASRMESHGLSGKIQVSEATYQLLQHRYLLELRGTISVKGKGDMTTYFLLGKKREASRGIVDAPRQDYRHTLRSATQRLVEQIEDKLRDCSSEQA